MLKIRGFTLIELVMIIVILGILAAVAIPRYIDLQNQAKEAAEDGVAGGVRGGIHTYFAENRAWPAHLDLVANDTDCSTTDPCFDKVLQPAITADWSKNSSGNYVGPGGGTFTYDNADGSFLE